MSGIRCLLTSRGEIDSTDLNALVPAPSLRRRRPPVEMEPSIANTSVERTGCTLGLCSPLPPSGEGAVSAALPEGVQIMVLVCLAERSFALRRLL